MSILDDETLDPAPKLPVDTEKLETISLWRQHGSVSRQLQDGDRLAVGGNIFGKVDRFLVIDADPFENFFKRLEVLLERNGGELASWMLKKAEYPSSLTVETLAKLIVFTKGLQRDYPFSVGAKKDRTEMYDAEKSLRLSALVFRGLHLCSECSALGQLWLQRQGIKSWLMGGAYVRPEDNSTRANAHDFLALPSDKEVLVYDPTQPFAHDVFGHFPNVLKINMGWEAFVHLMCDRWAFVEAHPLFYSNASVYYGNSAFCPVSKQELIRC